MHRRDEEPGPRGDRSEKSVAVEAALTELRDSRDEPFAVPEREDVHERDVDGRVHPRDVAPAQKDRVRFVPIDEAEAARTLQLLCHMWTTTNCDEGRDAWKSAQAKYPVLNAVPFPPTPRAPAKSHPLRKD